MKQYYLSPEYEEWYEKNVRAGVMLFELDMPIWIKDRNVENACHNEPGMSIYQGEYGKGDGCEYVPVRFIIEKESE